MSNEEKKKREQYRIKRQNRIKLFTIIVTILSLLTLFSFITYNNMNKTVYINYLETGNIDYKVYLKDNEFYDEEYLGKDNPKLGDIIH